MSISISDSSWLPSSYNVKHFDLHLRYNKSLSKNNKYPLLYVKNIVTKTANFRFYKCPRTFIRRGVHKMSRTLFVMVENRQNYRFVIFE